MYSIQNKVGLGVEYYAFLGELDNLLPDMFQEHMAGPMFDLLVDPAWELNAGLLFGLNDYSNQSVLKIIMGRRFGG